MGTRRSMTANRFLRTLFLFCLLLPATAAGDEAEKRIPLFDGKTLDGWIQRGGKAEYSVEDGCIVGRTVPNTPNSFLCTKKHYADFILEYEFKVDERLNSGVQIRSNSFAGYMDGRVHGYQVEIDPDMKRARLWTAGIYDEARRGWLNDLSKNDKAREAFKPDAWNHVRVHAEGDSIRTFLNGVPAADLLDGMTVEGFIGLQVHGIGNRQDGPFEVRWRNLYIQDLGRHAWKPLFNGKDLDGWEANADGFWEVEKGLLTGRKEADEPRHIILFSKKRYKDFAVRAVFRAMKGDSGFYFRSERLKEQPGVKGFQAEIDPESDRKGEFQTGGLYETGGRKWVLKPPAEVMKAHLKQDGWNELAIHARGDRIVVRVNGRKTAELTEAGGLAEGHFGLQLHGGQDMDITFRQIDLLVKEK